MLFAAAPCVKRVAMIVAVRKRLRTEGSVSERGSLAFSALVAAHRRDVEAKKPSMPEAGDQWPCDPRRANPPWHSKSFHIKIVDCTSYHVKGEGASQ